MDRGGQALLLLLLLSKEVSYLMRIEGVNRIVHLHQKSFIFRNMPIYTFDSKGNRQKDHPYFKVDCYYSGYVEAAPDSDVVLSTCIGLWGYIQIGSLKYEIKPVENSREFQHLIYRKDPEQHEPCKGILEDQDQLAEFPGNKAPSRYLEYFAVCDNSMFQRENQNVTQVILAVLQIISVLHNIYDGIGLHVVLTGMELWTVPDNLIINYTLDNYLEAFHSYATSELRRHAHFSHASLFTIVGKDGSITMFQQGHFCINNYVSVSAVKASSSLTKDGVAAAHQLGHVIGFVHDELLGEQGRMCDCNCTSKPGHCVMYSAVAECHRLSNCSKNAYYEFLANEGNTCFLSLPKDVFEFKICGNGVLEANEGCDCGRDEECERNGCCQKFCILKPGAECTHGLCCKNCKIENEGTLCREAATECDLPEYCSGDSADCPLNVYKQDGMPCGTRNNCYLGDCLDRHQHCRALFGKGANPGPLSCYKEVNMRGDRTGNCGKDEFGFKKCKEEDVFCGRVQCTDVKNVPRISTGEAILQTPMDDDICWGTEFQKGDEEYDLGAVKDGSPCGAAKICMNRTCVDLKILNYDCDFSKCNNQGVCNSKRNCHCTYGWAPPFCSGKGFGGSVDSGPAPEQRKSKKTLMLGSIIGVAMLLLTLSIVLKKYLHTWKEHPSSALTRYNLPVDAMASAGYPPAAAATQPARIGLCAAPRVPLPVSEPRPHVRSAPIPASQPSRPRFAPAERQSAAPAPAPRTMKGAEEETRGAPVT
ncbi:disintegrin and metalloproteinase domain-containing protein 29-like [Elgaria multicarinata webbii]|uniref:disintegrin and metalloproteinase domain-containing protein 29-like n=1 Tax=Elgaria multicarinata webbii TaxID=159646 RepID=UPI002FCCC03C